MEGLSFQDLLRKKEDLHPELEPFLNIRGSYGVVLQHPLVYSVPYHPNLNALLNAQFEQKTELIRDAQDRKDWDQLVALYERPYRLKAFQRIQKQLNDRTYWRLLASIWVDSENIWQLVLNWERLLCSKRSHREKFMFLKERKVLAALPDIVTVYRGYIPNKNKKSLSFTLCKDKAQWFAKRFSKDGDVRTLMVKKDDVFAYVNCREEQEIILVPRR